MSTKDRNGTVPGKTDVTAASLQKFKVRTVIEGTKVLPSPEELGDQRLGSGLLVLAQEL